MTRTRTYVLVALVVLSSAAVPLAAAQSGTGPLVSQTTTDLTTEWFGLTTSVDDRVIQYEAGGQLRPSWVVGFQAGSAQSVRDWANSSDARRIVRLDNSSQTATIVAPAGDMGLTLVDQVFGGSLSDRSYVTSLEANFEIGVDPIETLQPQSEVFDPPSGVVQGAFDQTGVAYRDAPNGNPADVRSVFDQGNVSVDASGMKIGVIDTGINTGTDGALYGNGTRGSTLRVTAAKNFVDANRPTGLDAVSTDNLHGPWVASAIAANTTDPAYDGVVPNANLVVAKALADDGSGETADIAASLRWMESQSVPIVSMSLGSPLYSQELADATRHYLQKNGTAIFLAVGNSKQNPAVRFLSSPSDVPEPGVISVASTTAQRPGNASVSYYSQVSPNVHERDGGPEAADGQQVDVAAPGQNVTVQVSNDGTLTTHTLSGTSMSTPYAAAAGLALLAEEPGLRNDTDAFRERLLETAEPVEAAGKSEVGHGMVNVENLITDTRPETSQTEARSTAAVARDAANNAYAGRTQGWISNTISDLSTGIGGFWNDATSALPV